MRHNNSTTAAPAGKRPNVQASHGENTCSLFAARQSKHGPSYAGGPWTKALCSESTDNTDSLTPLQLLLLELHASTRSLVATSCSSIASITLRHRHGDVPLGFLLLESAVFLMTSSTPCLWSDLTGSDHFSALWRQTGWLYDSQKKKANCYLALSYRFFLCPVSSLR